MVEYKNILLEENSGFVKQGAHLMKPCWGKPHTHSNPTNLALFRHKITLCRFSQGAHTIAAGSNWRRGLSPLPPSLLPVEENIKLEGFEAILTCRHSSTFIEFWLVFVFGRYFEIVRQLVFSL